jgi:hypothetical protein
LARNFYVLSQPFKASSAELENGQSNSGPFVLPVFVAVLRKLRHRLVTFWRCKLALKYARNIGVGHLGDRLFLLRHCFLPERL